MSKDLKSKAKQRKAKSKDPTAKSRAEVKEMDFKYQL